MEDKLEIHPIEFRRIGDRPIVVKNRSLAWESGGVLAPAVIIDNKTTIWHMIYRAFGSDKVSRLGYATSHDGINWHKNLQPLVVPDGSTVERDGLEDPRIIRIDDTYVITYTAYNRLAKRVQTHIRILITKDFVTFKRVSPHLNGFLHHNDKDGVLFPQKIHGRYLMLHRVDPNIQISSSINLKKWVSRGTLLKPTSENWENLKVGAGAPPILSPIGWIIFYHGVSKESHYYSMGAAVLDANKPQRVLYRLPFSLLRSAKKYETKGVVQHVVFGTSVIDMGTSYRLYYGAADDVIAMAEINKAKLIHLLLKYPVK